MCVFRPAFPVVSIGGYNYLVDVTNDENPVGKLFMVGSTKASYSNQSHIYYEAGGLRYEYDVDTLMTYNKSEYMIESSNCPTYTVTWKNSNGKVLETDYKVAKGEIPTYNGSTPYLSSDYKFVGWDKSLSAVTGNTVFTAKFEKDENVIQYNAGNYSGTYSGSYCKTAGLTNINPSNAVVRYGTSQGEYNLTSVPDVIDAGVYTYYYRISADGYRTDTGSFTVTINKAENSWTKEPAISDWTYGEQPSVPIGATKYGTPVFTYSSSENGTFTSTVPTLPGAYYMKVSVAESKNYNGLSQTVKFQINNALICGDFASSVRVDYDGKPHTIVPPKAVSPANCIVRYGTQSNTYDLTEPPTFTDTGYHNVYYKISCPETGDYFTWSAYVTINKVGNSWTTEPSIADWQSGKTASTPKGASKWGSVKFTYSDSPDGTFTSTKPTKPGTYLMRATVEGTANYYGLQKTVKFTITGGSNTDTSKENSWLIKPYIDNWVYGDTPANPQGMPKFGTVAYTYSTLANGTYTSVKPTNAGTYYLKATATYNGNSFSETYKFNIYYRSFEFELSYGNAARYDGKSHTIANPVIKNASNVTYKYSLDNKTFDITTKPSYINAGKYTFFTSISAPNYSPTSQMGGIYIRKGYNSWVQQPAINGWTYGDTPSTPTAKAKFGTVSFRYSQTEPYRDISYSQAAYVSGNCYMKATVAETVNYYGLTAIVPVKVEERTLQCTFPKELTVAYDGKAHSPSDVTVAATQTNYTIRYGLKSGKYDLRTMPEFTKGGTYNVYVEISATTYKTVTGVLKLTIKQSRLYGDLDTDGKITAGDSLLVLRQSVGLVKFDDTKQKLADVDGNGKISSADSLEILRYSVNLATKSKMGKEYS